MTIEQFITENTVMIIVVLMLLMVWDVIWKGIALYLAGKKEQKVWFVFLLIINSVGILPIIYLVLNRKKSKKKEIEK